MEQVEHLKRVLAIIEKADMPLSAFRRVFLFHLFRLFHTSHGTEQGRWSGPIDTAAPRPGFAGPGARGIRRKERPAGAGDSAIKRSACGWFIPTRSQRSLPPNKGKAVARLLPAPRSGRLPLPAESRSHRTERLNLNRTPAAVERLRRVFLWLRLGNSHNNSHICTTGFYPSDLARTVIFSARFSVVRPLCVLPVSF